MGDDYSFLQEKIKDEAGSPKTMRKKIFRMILLGIIFGIVACFTFFALKPWVEDLLGQDKKEVSIPEDEMTDVQEPSEEISQEIDEQMQMELLKSFQNVSKSVKSTIVTVTGRVDFETAPKSTTGVVIADNGSEVLILSQTLSEKGLKNVDISFLDGTEFTAKPMMQDHNMGIGIWAVNKDHISDTTWKQIKNAELGNSFLIETGDPGILLGMSSSGELKVSYGFVVSETEKTDMADGNVDVLCVDVAGAIFKDGMLFNQNGEMIGVVNKSSDDKLIDVYSISDIKKEIEYMSNGKPVPYIGIQGVELPDELKMEGLEEGICVQEIDTESPAMEAGIQCGDVIIKVADTDISSMKGYRAALLKENVKSTVVLTGLRKGADDNYVEMEFEVVVGRK